MLFEAVHLHEVPQGHRALDCSARAGRSKAAALLLLLFAHFDLRAACDNLKVSPTNPYAYLPQKDDAKRCEGIYIAEVAGIGTILLVSLLHGSEQPNPAAGNLVAFWPLPEPATTNLRSYSLRSDIHYRMDLQLPAGTTQYRWPLQLAKEVGLKEGQLGLVAWSSLKIDTTGVRDVFLPISRSSADSYPSDLTASFWAPVAMRAVALMVSPHARNPQSQPMKLTKPGQYPPARRIDFSLTAPLKRGFYELRISAEDEFGTPLVETYVIFAE